MSPDGINTFAATRSDGNIVMFNRLTDEFAVVTPDGTINTYYQPDPNFHMTGTNFDYYIQEVNK